MRDVLPPLPPVPGITVDPARFDAAVTRVRRRHRRRTGAAAVAVLVAGVLSLGSDAGRTGLAPTGEGTTATPTAAPSGPPAAAPRGTPAVPRRAAAPSGAPVAVPRQAAAPDPFPARAPLPAPVPCPAAEEAVAAPPASAVPDDVSVVAELVPGAPATRAPGESWQVRVTISNTGTLPTTVEVRRLVGGVYDGDRYVGGGDRSPGEPTSYDVLPDESVVLLGTVGAVACRSAAGGLPYGRYFLRAGVETDRGVWYGTHPVFAWVADPGPAGCFGLDRAALGRAPAPGLTIAVRMAAPPRPEDTARAVVTVTNPTGRTLRFVEVAPDAPLAYLLRGDRVMGGWTEGAATARPLVRELSPGERWVTTVLVRGESCRQRQPMASGAYDLLVGLHVEVAGRRYYWTAPRVAVHYPG